MKVLMLDVGGSSVKLMASGQGEFRKVRTGRAMSAGRMVKMVQAATEDWEYDAISLGYPGLVKGGRIARDPGNLSGDWVKFDFEKAMKKPVRIINDAAMQALARYQSGRMLFLGLGTSVGAALIADDTLVPIEAGMMRLSKSVVFKDRLSKKSLRKLGRVRWAKAVARAIAILADVFWPDTIAVGGGNAKLLKPLPPHCELGDNQDAFRGACRLWPGAGLLAEPLDTTWRIRRSGK